MKKRFLFGFCLFLVLSAGAGQTFASHPGLHPVPDKNGKWGFIDRTGSFRIAPRYVRANEFSDGVAYVFFWEGDTRMNGIVDTAGKFTLLQTNDYEVSFHDGLAKFQTPGGQEQKFGYMDKAGRVVIKPQFYFAGDFYEGRAWVEVLENGEWVYGYIDKTGAFVIPPQFKAPPSDFAEGLARVMGKQGWGFIDRAGKFVIPPKFQIVDSSFAEGLAAAVYAGDTPRAVYLGHSGQEAFEIPLWKQRTARQQAIEDYRWHLNIPFSEGLAPVKSFNKIGFINKTGKVVIEPLFRDVQSFSEGLAGVKIIGSDGNYVWGFIDRSGNFVIEAQFIQVAPFAGGLARVESVDGKKCLIDHTGKIVWNL
jgi:WG containing repeat